jgi:hypothetical protein
MRWARTHWIAIVTAGALFLVVIGIGALGSSSKSATETTTLIKTKTQVRTETQVNWRAVAIRSIKGDGTFRVGEDIAPGTYRSPPPSSGTCYWARLRDLGSGSNSIIATSNTSGPSLLRVAASDFAVKTRGCERFKRIGEQSTR